MPLRLRKAKPVAPELAVRAVPDAVIAAEAARRELAVSPTIVGALLLELGRRLEHDRLLLDELRAARTRSVELEQELADLRERAFRWFEGRVRAEAEVSRLAAMVAIGSLGIFDFGETEAWCRAAYGRVLTVTNEECG